MPVSIPTPSAPASTGNMTAKRAAITPRRSAPRRRNRPASRAAALAADRNRPLTARGSASGGIVDARATARAPADTRGVPRFVARCRVSGRGKKADRPFEHARDVVEPARRDAAQAALVFVRLLKRDADLARKALQRYAHIDAAFADACGDALVDQFCGLMFHRLCLVGRRWGRRQCACACAPCCWSRPGLLLRTRRQLLNYRRPGSRCEAPHRGEKTPV